MGLSVYPLEVVQLGQDLMAFKWYFTASCALLAYDYCLVIHEEVIAVWKRSKNSIFYLFLVNRYFPIAFCVITLFAYNSPLWTPEICNHFAIIEWLQALIVAISAETVLLIRVYALSGRNRLLASFLVSIMIAQCSIVFYAMAQPGKNGALPVPHIPLDVFHVCILYSQPHMDTAYLATSLVFDSIVFFLTLRNTINGNTIVPRTVLLQTIQRDGVLYFCIILAGNMIWMMLALCARPGLKLLNAQPSMILTSIMVCRLTISLRQAGEENTVIYLETCHWARNDVRSEDQARNIAHAENHVTLAPSDDHTLDQTDPASHR